MNDRPYLNITQRKASEILLDVFKQLSLKEFPVVVGPVKRHGDCWCTECRRIRHLSPVHDLALTTFGCLAKEFAPNGFDELVQSAEDRVKLMLAELRSQLRTLPLS